MILFFVTIGIAVVVAAATTAAGVDDNKDENESLGVSEGENLTISIHINNSDEDPQVLVIYLKGSAQEAIAQLICHNRVCESEYWISGVSLMSDGENVTLILMNVRYNQTGLYEVRKLSGTQLENKIYNITVYHPGLSTISPELLPSVRNRKSFTAGVTSAAVGIPVLLITAAVIGVFYWKHRKATSYEVSKDDNSAANSLCGSRSVIDI